MRLFSLFVDGINPEPWRSPSLGVGRAGGRVRPLAYKDENLRAYQAALHEVVAEALTERAIATPIFPAGTELNVTFVFYRQLDDYQGGKRRNRRQRADATNLLKAAEDALQGLLYANDNANRRVTSEIAAADPETNPGVLVIASSFQPVYPKSTETLKQKLEYTSTVDRSRTVWLRSVKKLPGKQHLDTGEASR